MILVKCDNCNKEFLCQNWRTKQRKHLFCSKQCEGEYRRNQTKPNVKCVVCGKEYHLKPSDLKQTDQHCCSLECLGIYRQTLYLGENNPNYGNKGEKNPLWKSDKKITNYGYIKVRQIDHPFKDCDGFVFEHRLIAEQFLLTEENSIMINGKYYLKPEYNVHHKDKNKMNNKVDNLQILTRSEHMKLHHILKKNK